ncbi:hypothetical protein FRC12_018932 [Ceratobasidium sp. 428]|nr:hypothetical protein FRC12_018932 [Ceratobasidium sp. 428]
MVSPPASFEPPMAQRTDRAASYGPVPTSPNTATTPVGDPSRLQSAPPARTPSTYVSSPLNPNAPMPGAVTRSRPPSSGSSALQAEFAELHNREGSSDGDTPRNVISALSYDRNTLYAVSQQFGPSAWHSRRRIPGSCSTPDFSSQPLRPPSTAVNHRFSTMSSTGSILSFASDSKYPAYAQNNLSNGAFVEAFPYGGGESPDMWAPLDDGPEDDDALHEPDPKGYKEQTGLSGRGFLNVGMLVLVITALLALFISYPIVHYVRVGGFPMSNLVNGTGQVADLYDLILLLFLISADHFQQT